MDGSGRFSDEQVVDWLIDECRDAGTRIAAVTTSGDRIFAVGSTVIVLTATVAVGGGRGHLLMWLPLAISLITVYVLYLNNLVRTLIGYKIGLEREIERRVGVPVIAWQGRINRASASKPHTKAVLILSGIVYLVSVGVGVAEAFRTVSPGAWGHERAWLYVSLTMASVVVGLGLIAYCFRLQQDSIKTARGRMAELFKEENS